MDAFRGPQTGHARRPANSRPKEKPERRARTERTFNPDPTVVRVDDRARDEEAQAEPATARIAALAKPLEDRLVHLGRDARPGVADRNLDAITAARHRRRDRATRGRKLERVRNQVIDDAHDARRIDRAHNRFVWQLGAQRELVRGSNAWLISTAARTIWHVSASFLWRRARPS